MTTTDTAALVRKMREALIAVESSVDIGLQRRKAIADADQWLAQQRGPLTGAEDAGIMQLIDDYAKAVHDGADDRCEVLRRTIEGSLLYASQQHRAHGIGQPAWEDKPC